MPRAISITGAARLLVTRILAEISKTYKNTIYVFCRTVDLMFDVDGAGQLVNMLGMTC